MEKADDVTDDQFTGASEMHDRIMAILDENNIDLDELIE